MQLSEEEVAIGTRAYFATITFTDSEIGRLLDAARGAYSLKRPAASCSVACCSLAFSWTPSLKAMTLLQRWDRKLGMRW
eukprot:COSAG02_NODE_4604_length_5175_cov_13.327817_4_plen_79_part_00